jgi:putative thioredoxin
MHALYFTAKWCQPCKVFGPIMEKVQDSFVVNKLDADENFGMLESMSIMSVPTVVFLDDDLQELGRFTGARTEQWVRDFAAELGA